MRTPAVILLVAVTFAACSPTTPPSPSPSAGAAAAASPVRPNPTPLPSSRRAASGVPAASASRLTLGDATNCPVSKPEKAPEDIGDRLFGSAVAFGNTDLWVGGLGDEGVILADSRFAESDGSIGWKFGWWRMVPGRLTITGRRLDAPAPPPRASVPDGYGPQGFQASGVSFPTEGCWEVTGAVGGSKLTFVIFVLRT